MPAIWRRPLGLTSRARSIFEVEHYQIPHTEEHIKTQQKMHTKRQQNHHKKLLKQENTTKHKAFLTHANYQQQVKQQTVTKLQQKQHENTKNVHPKTHTKQREKVYSFLSFSASAKHAQKHT